MAIGFSEYLRDHLESAGVLAIFYVVNNAGHSYDMSGREISPSFDEIADFVILFLNAVIP